MSAQATEQQAAIELIVEHDEQGQVAANVAVRWRISPEMVQSLAQQGIEPFMLLVVSNGNQEMDRTLVPLKLGMTFLQMSRPGTNVIHGTIVWQQEDEEPVKDIIMAKNDHGAYRLELVRWFRPGVAGVKQRMAELRWEVGWWSTDDGNTVEMPEEKAEFEQLRGQLKELKSQSKAFGLFDHFEAIGRATEGDLINVEVPEEMFAPDPPRWMTWLGTRYRWPKRFMDQCDLRQRVWITVLSAPFVIPAILVVGVVIGCLSLLFAASAVVVTGVLLFFGKRNLDYSVIYKLGRLELKHIWRHAGPSVWLYKKIDSETGSRYEPRDPAFDWINPPALVFFIGTLLVFNGFEMSSVLIGIAAPVVIGLLKARIDKQSKRDEARDDEDVIAAEQRTRLERDLSLLTIGGSAKLSDLPIRQRTVRLRYLNLKASVCKPFAR